MAHLQFHEMGLDDRLLKAIAKLGWAQPTLIQEKAIPLALEGKDVLVRAKTGSGKTAIYAIPLVQKLLQASSNGTSICSRALVIVPSKELSLQAARNVKELLAYCPRTIKVLDVCSVTDAVSQRTILLEKPDVVVGTPSRILAHLHQRTLTLKGSLELLVIDEADLVFSYGYEQDLKAIISYLPSIYQACLMSATLSEDVQTVRKLVLHNPVVLKLEESDLPESTRLAQYHVRCSVEDKYLLICTLLKLKLIRGKSLLFVNDIDHCYKLKLFLEQFCIKSCVLNSELPHNSRCHIVEEFNRGVYDYIIATDEAPEIDVVGGQRRRGQKRRKDKEYGVVRGIDFQGVENVINFDFPPSSDAYIHRVGRTARGMESGSSLTFVTPTEESLLEQVQQNLQKEAGGATELGIKPYKFKMSEIEGFRYRVQDSMRAVTKAAVKEARMKEIRTEILNSEKLKHHFEDNPRDLQVLRHDNVLQPTRVQPHLKHVPSYLMPKALQQMVDSSLQYDSAIHLASKKPRRKITKKTTSDPLKSFSYVPKNAKPQRKEGKSYHCCK